MKDLNKLLIKEKISLEELLQTVPVNILAELVAFNCRLFCRVVLPDMFYHPTLSEFHLYLLSLVEKNQRTRKREVVAGPRGWGKSTTISEGGVVWILTRNLYLPERKQYKNIMIISDTSRQAKGRLATIKNILESNTMLATLFPEVVGKGSVWAKDVIITKSGVKISAFGIDSKIRGEKYLSRRPDLIIVDDPDSLTSVSSPSLNKYVEDVFTRDICKCGDELGDILVVGTVVGKQALVSKLLYSEEYAIWKGKIFKALPNFPEGEQLKLWDNFGAILKDRENKHRLEEADVFYEQHEEELTNGIYSLWPEVYSVKKLMAEYYLEGRKVFMLEKQNVPVEEEDAYFNLKDYYFWENEEEILKQNPLLFMYIDPSGGQKRTTTVGRRKGDSDLFVLSIIAKVNNRKYYLLDMYADQIRQSAQYFLIKEKIIYWAEKGFPIFKLEVEDRGDAYYYNGLKEFLKREGIFRPLPRLKINTISKEVRIKQLEPYLDAWTLILPRDRKKFKFLYAELENWPYSEFDDCLDSLSGCFFSAYKSFSLKFI